MRRVVVGWLFAGALSGCDPGPPTVTHATGEACRLTVDRQAVCDGGGSRSEFVESREVLIHDCQEAPGRTVEDDRAALKCVALAGCGEFKECVARLEEKMRLRRVAIEVAKTLRGSGDAEYMLEMCSQSWRDDAELGALCDELGAQVMAGATVALQRVRDDPSIVAEVECTDWRNKAEKISSEAQRSVDALCAEIDASRAVAAALRDVWGEFSLDDAPEIPETCRRAVALLDPLTSGWAEAKREEVTRACYLELGRRLLPRLVPTMKRCGGPAAEIYAGVKRFGFTAPGIDPWIARIERKCATAK